MQKTETCLFLPLSTTSIDFIIKIIHPLGTEQELKTLLKRSAALELTLMLSPNFPQKHYCTIKLSLNNRRTINLEA